MERKKNYLVRTGMLVLSCVMLLAGVLMLSPQKVQAASNMRLNKKSITLVVAKSKKLKVKGTKKKVTWKSNNKKVATVNSKGVVVARKAGTTKIVAKIGKKKLTCKVTVKKNEWRRYDTISESPFAPSVTVVKTWYNQKGKVKAQIVISNPSVFLEMRISEIPFQLLDRNGKVVASTTVKGNYYLQKKGSRMITVTCNSTKKVIDLTRTIHSVWSVPR